MNEGSPTFSIVIEWENARLSELVRTRKMLKQLHKQLIEAIQAGHPRPELIILHDKDHVDGQLVKKVVGEASEPEAWPADVRIIPTDGLDYFGQKNFGAQQSDKDLVIFLDSDVIPEPGWLAGLLEAFRDPDIQVVYGNTYISLEGFYSKALALFYVFPLRTEGNDLVRTNVPSRSYADNMAIRREIFEAFGRFPNLPTFRRRCVVVQETLREHGVDIFLQQRSRVSHPAPNGLRHFISRALCHGHDQVIDHDRVTKRLRGKGRAGSLTASSILATSSAFYLYSLGRSLKRIARHYRDVRLGLIGAAGAFGLAACYFTLKFAGALVTYVRPELIRHHFSI